MLVDCLDDLEAMVRLQSCIDGAAGELLRLESVTVARDCLCPAHAVW